MPSGHYSQTKAAWHLDRIEALRAGRVPAPVHVQLVLSDLCNHNCSFCAYRRGDGLSSELFADETGNTNPNRRIGTGKALEIVDDCATLGVKAIQFTGGGEPTVHRDHLHVFAAAQQHGIKTALVTNGIKLATHPANLGHTWVRVSIDAGTEATYCSVREVSASHWAKVWENLAEFAKAYTGVLTVGFVVTNENFREIRECARMARAAGASGMRVGAVFTEKGMGFYDDVQRVRQWIADAVKEHGDFITNLFDRRVGDLEHGSPDDPFCGYQYLTTYIGADLNVYRCCNTSYTKAGTIGSLKDGVRFRDLALAPKPFDARGCHYCQFLGINKSIAALVTQPAHAEFV